MRAAVLHDYGAADQLKYEDAPDPIPSSGEVLVKVAAAGINPVDFHERTGATKEWRPLRFPAIIGWDVSGTVASLGSGVSNLAIGDRVCAWSYHTYAELCADKANLFAKVPDGIDLVDAAAYPLVTLTGGQLISQGSGIKAGQTVIVSGAAGGVGRSAVYTAKSLGATVFAGVQRKQLGQAESIGAHQTVALDDDEAFAKLPAFDVVANAVRGKTASMLMSKVKDGGTFASVTGPPENAKDYPSVKVVAFVSKQDSAMLETMLGAIRDGKLRIPVDRRVPLRDAATAHVAVERGGIGKVLLIP